jgi:hypothetical protein
MMRKKGKSATGFTAFVGKSAALAKLTGARAANDSTAAANALLRYDILNTPKLTITLIEAVEWTILRNEFLVKPLIMTAPRLNYRHLLIFSESPVALFKAIRDMRSK